MISSMSVPICNRFTLRANSLFKGAPLFDAFARGESFTHGDEILSLKTRVFRAAHSKDFVILACTVLIQITSVTDRRTDGQTDAIDNVYKTRDRTRDAFCYRALKVKLFKESLNLFLRIVTKIVSLKD